MFIHALFGLSLIEVLISLFFLSLMLLGLDLMQLTTLHQTKAAYFFSIANQQIFNMSERILVSQENTLSQQIAYWNEQNRQLLPQGKGEIFLNHSNYVITVFWGGYEKVCDHNQVGLQGCLQYLS